MPSALAAPRVGAVLSRLYAAATHDSRHSSPSARARAAASPAERSRVFQEVSFPVSAEVGKLLYALVRASRPQMVVEFGTSFGVAAIYLAAAVADNGAGHVVTTELSSKKVQAARSNLQQAGLGEMVSMFAAGRAGRGRPWQSRVMVTAASIPCPVKYAGSPLRSRKPVRCSATPRPPARRATGSGAPPPRAVQLPAAEPGQQRGVLSLAINNGAPGRRAKLRYLQAKRRRHLRRIWPYGPERNRLWPRFLLTKFSPRSGKSRVSCSPASLTPQPG